jgi:hypothetical protein
MRTRIFGDLGVTLVAVKRKITVLSGVDRRNYCVSLLPEVARMAN